MNYDHLSASVNEFASPSVSFNLETVTLQERSFGGVPGALNRGHRDPLTHRPNMVS
jgi:hypothetical protein